MEPRPIIEDGRSSPLFTILLPVVRPPVLLPFAIESVLAQSVPQFELLIVCDGAPAETVACAQDFSRRDPRVQLLVFPKGERNGEAHRHVALAGACGRYVAHIGDDDLWFPDHLAELAVLLAQADFGNLLHVYVHPGGRVEILPGDLGLPAMRERMLGEKFNLFGPTVAGYRLAAYRALPEGWSPAPPDVWVDLHMWRKFLRMENLVFATRAAVSALVFATPQRHDVALAQREVENRTYLERIRDPASRSEIVAAAWHSLLSRDLQTERQVLVLGAARDGLAAELERTGALLAAQKLEVDRLLRSNGELAAGLDRAGVLFAAQELDADRLVRSNRELVAELARATALAAASAHEIEHMLGSRSWRLTAPLRKSFAVAARLYGSLRRA